MDWCDLKFGDVLVRDPDDLLIDWESDRPESIVVAIILTDASGPPDKSGSCFDVLLTTDKGNCRRFLWHSMRSEIRTWKLVHRVEA